VGRINEGQGRRSRVTLYHAFKLVSRDGNGGNPVGVLKPGVSSSDR
jgi:hypothetical protein